MPDFDSNVKKNVKNWLSALVALPAEARASIPVFNDLIVALGELQGHTFEQYNKDHTEKLMDDASYKILADAYKKAGTLCEACFEQPQLDEDAAKLIRSISAYLAEDMNSLEQYNNRKTGEKVSFQTLIDRGHTQEINIGNAKVTRLGAAMSDRIAFHYKSMDGRDLNGVFTEKSVFNPAKEELDARAAYDAQYNEVMTLFEDAYDAYVKYSPDDTSIKGFYTHFAGSSIEMEKSAALKKELISYLNRYYTETDKPEMLAVLKKYGKKDDVFEDVFSGFRGNSSHLISIFNVNGIPSWEENLKNTKEKHEFMKLVFEAAYPAYLLEKGKEDSVAQKLIFYNEVGPLDNDAPKMRRRTLKQMVVKYLRSEGRVREAEKLQDMTLDTDPEFEAMMNAYRNHCSTMANKINVMSGGAHLSLNSRIDTRNTGMSIVADMLGRPELIAHAQPLKLNLGGKKIEGTFMALGKGTDLAKLKGSEALKQYTAKTFKTNGLRSVADLMVIDYICGNVDRHSHNMMYQFDMKGPASKHRFIGVQGIDNDSSFGEFDPIKDLIPGKDGIIRKSGMRFPYPDRIKVISQSMAAQVMKLSAKELKFRLRGQGLTDKQLNAAGVRLQQLQAMIRDGRKVKLVPDDQFCKLDLNKISDGDRSYFHALKNFSDMYRPYEFDREKLAPDVVNQVYGNSISSEDVEKVAAQLKKMADVTATGKTSDQFEQLRTALSNYHTFCVQHENTLLSQEHRQEKLGYLEAVNTAAIQYLEHKNHQFRFWTTDYAQKRIDLADQIRDEYNKLHLATLSAKYGTDSPELQQQIDEYNNRTLELLDTRIAKEPAPALRVEVPEPQEEKQIEKQKIIT